MHLRTITFLLIIFLGAVAYPQDEDKFIQILHVNDLHSFWEHSEHEPYGGYAKLKALMDKLEAEGDAKGWITLRLDAGDFSGGHINFFADQGKVSFRLEQLMKFDAIALGNHDYLTGAEDLVTRAKDPEQRLPLLAANFFYGKDTGVSPGIIINRGGLKIAIGGATVQSIAYSWAALPAQITSPYAPLERWFEGHPADVSLALTHLGVDLDQVYAGYTKIADVIIGGHTHITLPQPIYVKNKMGNMVPIVQAGAHGIFLGQMVLRVTKHPLEKSHPICKSSDENCAPPKPYKIQVELYQLHRISPNLPEDGEISFTIHQGILDLQNSFSENLNEVVAHSEKTYWSYPDPVPLVGNLFADSLREASGAEIAVDSTFLYSEKIPQGDVTIYDVFNLTPHTYGWKPLGWNIFRCQARAVTLAAGLDILTGAGGRIAVSGMSIDLGPFNLIRKITVQGDPYQLRKTYDLAMSEGFARALESQPTLKNLLCDSLKDTGLSIREALLQKIRTLQVVSDHSLGVPRVHLSSTASSSANIVPLQPF